MPVYKYTLGQINTLGYIYMYRTFTYPRPPSTCKETFLAALLVLFRVFFNSKQKIWKSEISFFLTLAMASFCTTDNRCPPSKVAGRALFRAAPSTYPRVKYNHNPGHLGIQIARYQVLYRELRFQWCKSLYIF